MNFNRVMGLILIVGGAVFGLATALRGQAESGDWTIRRSDEPGKVEVSIMDSRGGPHFPSTSLLRAIQRKGAHAPLPAPDSNESDGRQASGSSLGIRGEPET